MLLLNGIIALIGIAIAVFVMFLKVHFLLHGLPFIAIAFVGLWLYLTLSDLAEQWIIQKFNPGS